MGVAVIKMNFICGCVAEMKETTAPNGMPLLEAYRAKIAHCTLHDSAPAALDLLRESRSLCSGDLLDRIEALLNKALV